MNETTNDPHLLLFACEQCGFWPMAYQGMRPYGGDASFSCSRCKATAVFKVKNTTQARPRLEAMTG